MLLQQTTTPAIIIFTKIIDINISYINTAPVYTTVLFVPQCVIAKKIIKTANKLHSYIRLFPSFYEL